MAPGYYATGNNGHGYPAGGWYGDYSVQARGNYGQFRGAGRWYGPTAGFRGGYEQQPTFAPTMGILPSTSKYGPCCRTAMSKHD